MTRETTLETAAARTIGGRVYGPFREAGSKPGDTSRSRLEKAARVYLWKRRVHHVPAARALELAAREAYNPGWPKQWFGPRGSVGAVWERSGDRYRWFESTADAGLRFVAWADQLPGGPDHSGWYSRDDDFGDMLRGGVWQLPGRKGKARLIYGFAEFDGRDSETNPGSAAICVSDILEADRRGDESLERQEDSDASRDAARWADGIAESEAEMAREYDAAWQRGRQAAELDAEAAEARRELLPLLRELQTARKLPIACQAFPAAIAALRDRVSRILETISKSREKRDSLWSDCWQSDAEAWRAGFCDNAEGGFLRAVRLGYAKAADWQGPADQNPCNAGA